VYKGFLAALEQGSDWPSDAHVALEACYAATFDRGRAAHPGIRGSEALFAEALGAKLASEESLEAGAVERALADFDAPALFLAAACADGQSDAIERFETLYFTAIPKALRSMGAQPADIDDVLSVVREKLFIAADGERPRVLGFVGGGSLEKLCKVVAARTLLNRQRSKRRERVSGDEALADIIAPHNDPELAAVKEHHRDAFRAAFAEAIAKLSSEDRNLLRLSLIHRMSIDEVGRIYQIHRSTAARRLTRLRDAIAQDTQMYLRVKLGADRQELQSLFRLVQSGLDRSFIRLLGKTATRQ
jgi:RNA polymerase sigma-70 factor (ECF subfamily)